MSDEVRARRVGPGFHITLPRYARHDSRDTGIMLTRAEADALFDCLGAVLDRDAGLPRDRKMPSPPISDHPKEP